MKHFAIATPTTALKPCPKTAFRGWATGERMAL
jgi:hypothetical protein